MQNTSIYTVVKKKETFHPETGAGLSQYDQNPKLDGTNCFNSDHNTVVQKKISPHQ